MKNVVFAFLLFSVVTNAANADPTLANICPKGQYITDCSWSNNGKDATAYNNDQERTQVEQCFKELYTIGWNCKECPPGYTTETLSYCECEEKGDNIIQSFCIDQNKNYKVVQKKCTLNFKCIKPSTICEKGDYVVGCDDSEKDEECNTIQCEKCPGSGTTPTASTCTTDEAGKTCKFMKRKDCSLSVDRTDATGTFYYDTGSCTLNKQ